MKQQEYVKMYHLEARHWWFLAKQKFISAVFPKIKKPYILDIGAGTGGTTKFLQKYGEVVGLEANKEAVEFAEKRKLKIVAGTANKLPFKSKTFNVVGIFDVLYHQQIKSDLAVLKEAYRVLKPGGFLLVNDCAFEWLRGPHDRAVQARQRYTKSILIKQIKKAGFKIEKASYTLWLLFPLTVAKRMMDRLQAKLTGKSSFSDVDEVPATLNKILLNICLVEAKLLSYVDFPWGSSILVRARK